MKTSLQGQKNLLFRLVMSIWISGNKKKDMRSPFFSVTKHGFYRKKRIFEFFQNSLKSYSYATAPVFMSLTTSIDRNLSLKLYKSKIFSRI